MLSPIESSIICLRSCQSFLFDPLLSESPFPLLPSCTQEPILPITSKLTKTKAIEPTLMY